MLILIFLFQFSLFLCFDATSRHGVSLYFSYKGHKYLFRSSIRSPIIPQFNPNCILKAFYCQSSPKIQAWLHYPILLKVTWRKSCIHFRYRKIPGKVAIRPELGLPCPLQVNWHIYMIILFVYLIYVYKMKPK